jgi:uncharacterized coiled-coil protein SlyX
MRYWIISLCLISVVSFFLYTRTQDLEKTIENQKSVIETQNKKINTLSAQIIFEKSIVDKQKAALEVYKNKVQEIKTIIKPVVVYKEIIKTLTAEVIVETANEDTNEIISSITNSSNEFNRVHND